MNITPVFHKIRKREARGRVYYTLVYNPSNFKDAKCAGVSTENFYPITDKFTPEQERYIRERICGGCPVIEACAEWGLVHERYGIWGGMTPAMRDKERKRRGWALVDPQLKDRKN